MEKHHQAAIDQFIERYQNDPALLAILLGGSLAHGFAGPNADIDLILVVEEAEYQKRKNEGKLAFSIRDFCAYPGGYIDCKVVSPERLRLVAARGSDPARYAYQDSKILFSRLPGLDRLLAEIVRFPVAEQACRRERFAAQLLAWRWYYSQAVEKDNRYLLYLSLQKLLLFACRLVLNENRMLYPYHKWLLRVVAKAPAQPPAFVETLDRLLTAPTADLVEQLCNQVLSFLGLDETAIDWPNQFLQDSEENWVKQEPPVDDI
ncbi:MAG TPA: nucleotidyltransferase domain-containing protein [Capillibacterium sp.]